MNGYYVAGIIVGILVGVIILLFSLKATKTDGRLRSRHDERQKTAQGIGYKYGFFTLTVGCIIYAFALEAGIRFPASDSAILIFLVCLSVIVHVYYCIWKEAYLALNENRRRIMILFAALGGSNTLIGIGNVRNGQAFTEGILNIRCLNLIVGLMCLMVVLALFVKDLVQKGEGDE